MALHPLDSARSKLDRAKKHAEALKGEVRDFLSRNPYSTTGKLELETGEYRVNARLHALPTIEWSIILGDFAHNARGALDHVVWQLALKQTPTPDRKTQFPCFPTKHKKWAVRLRDLSRADVARVERFQPYNAGEPLEDPLYVLSTVSNADKHRMVQFCPCSLQVLFEVRANGGVVLAFSDNEDRITPGSGHVLGTEIEHSTLKLVNIPESGVEVEHAPSMAVLFPGARGKGAVYEVWWVLHDITKRVGQFIDEFAPDFP